MKMHLLIRRFAGTFILLSLALAHFPLHVLQGLKTGIEARGEAFYRHYIALALERAGGVQVSSA